MARKQRAIKTHSQVIQESVNSLDSKQKALLRTIITSAMITGRIEVPISTDYACAMFGYESERELFETFGKMYAAQRIDDYVMSDGEYNFKWYDGVIWDKDKKTITIEVNRLVFQFMRLRYDENKKALVLETLDDIPYP